jgi:serine/threonine protein kinase
VYVNSDHCDFIDAKTTKGTFVGTAEYASPEMLVPPTITTRASDIWAYGCVVFQMIAGAPPFKETTDYLTMKKIQEGKYQFPEGFDPMVRKMVEACLVVDPTIRITSGQLKEHSFFESIDWETIWKETPPPLASGLKPPERNDEDVNIHLNLTWTMDGSEDEMEDLRPAPEYRHHRESTIPMPSREDEPADEPAPGSSPMEARSSLETTPTRARDEKQMSFVMPSSSADMRTQMRRFSNDNKMERKQSVPFDGPAAIFSPPEEAVGKPRRFSANSETNARPRRISPSSSDGKPAKPRPRSEGLPEADEEASSEQWSAESPPSTVEHLESTLGAIEESMSGLGIQVHGSSGHELSTSIHSSVDVGRMSASGTSGGSTTSGGNTFGNRNPSKGFERLRGAKGVDLGASSTHTALSGEGWVLPNG